MKAQSLKPTKATNYYEGLRHYWQLFNKKQRQDRQPEMSGKQWLYNRNIDLSGRTYIRL